MCRLERCRARSPQLAVFSRPSGRWTDANRVTVVRVGRENHLVEVCSASKLKGRSPNDESIEIEETVAVDVVALVALFIALSGGAYAGVTLNQVRSVHIKNGEVKTVDLANNAVKLAKINNNAINSAKIQNSQVTSADLADGTVASADIADATVSSADITDGTIASADLAASATADLNDASTLGGLSVSQIVAAAGGRYLEARQAVGNVNVETLTDQNLVTLNLPEAGKYLITARMPVSCTYDGSDLTGATPDAAAALQPNLIAKARLFVGGTLTDTVTQTCEADSAIAVVLAAVFRGSTVVEITRQIEVTGPTAVQLSGLSETSLVLFFTFPAAQRITATASGSIIQSISVRT